MKLIDSLATYGLVDRPASADIFQALTQCYTSRSQPREGFARVLPVLPQFDELFMVLRGYGRCNRIFEASGMYESPIGNLAIPDALIRVDEVGTGHNLSSVPSLAEGRDRRTTVCQLVQRRSLQVRLRFDPAWCATHQGLLPDQRTPQGIAIFVMRELLSS